MSRSVAIVGFAEETMGLHWESNADEIWALNKAFSKDIKRIDRLFAMHTVRWMEGDQEPDNPEYMSWLKSNYKIPVVTLYDEADVIPMSEPYPIVDLVDDLLWNVTKGDEPIKYFNCTVAFMLAYCAYLGDVDRVEIYGVESNYFEYLHQRTAVEFWIGYLGGMRRGTI